MTDDRQNDGTVDALSALDTLLRPRSVAVVGASEDPRKMNGASVHNLVVSGYSGVVYPVNPRREVVQGLTCWPSLSDLPGVPDTVVIATPANLVCDTLREADKLGIRSATIVSAGFGEGAAGEDGQRREAELREVIHSASIRVIGPNTAGLLNVADQFIPRAALNNVDSDQMRAGGVAIVTQSGAISNILFNRAQVAGIGVHTVVATGDQVDLTVWEVAAHLAEQRDVSVICMVIETLGTLEHLDELGRLSREYCKPVLVLPLGLTDSGGSVVLSHTGSLTSDGAVMQAAISDAGFVLVRDFDTLWAAGGVVDRLDWSQDDEPNLGVFCISGGEAAFIADRLDEAGISLQPASEAFEQFVADIMSFSVGGNPFDATGEVLGKPEMLAPLLDAFIGHNDFSHVLVCSPVFRDEIAMRLYPAIAGSATKHAGRTVVSAWSAGSMTQEGIDTLSSGDFVFFDGSRLAVDALVAALEGHRQMARVEASSLLPPAQASGPTTAEGFVETDSPSYADARTTLSELGVPYSTAAVVSDAAEVESATVGMTFPVAIKANVPSMAHKAQDNLLELAVAGPKTAAEAVRRLMATGRCNDCVIEPMVGPGLDLIIGANRDPIVGPVITVGSGGRLVETLGDIAMSVGHIGERRAANLVRRTAVGAYVAGSEDKEFGALVDIVVRFSAWFASSPYQTAEINPLRLPEDSGQWIALDARIG